MSDALDLPLEEQELSQALKSMPNGKCPFRDGLTAEFYKMFWVKLKSLYFRAISYAIRHKLLHKSARQGIISLLPKKDRSHEFLKNWRPLTLMNVDYKIYSKAISLRLKAVIPFLINSDQTGFMAGRDFSLNIRKTLDVIQYTDLNQIKAVIVSVDYEHAFDSEEWTPIWGAMTFFGFGQSFIEYVKLLFAQSYCSVMNNGWFTEDITPTRATKQGCSVSPFLFNLVAELVAMRIRQSKDVKGITIRDIEYKIAQFADDMTMFLQFDKVTLFTVSKIFDECQAYTGLKVNYDKTSVYRIGSIKNTNAMLYTGKLFFWTNDPIKILGITVSHELEAMPLLNLAPVFDKMLNICQIWARRKITPTGKVVIVNNLISSLLIHKLTVLQGLTPMYIE